jgi:hypothetical protein
MSEMSPQAGTDCEKGIQVSDERQQQEAEESRMRAELDALRQLKEHGMVELAEFFAADLGITAEYQKEIA